MRIVILDGFTLNPGDLSWEPITRLGECEIYERTAEPDLLSRAAHAEILLINKVRLNGRMLRQLPRLQYIGVLATGTNCVDLDAARERSIIVTNVPNYGTQSVAQATFGLILELTNRVGHHADSVREGRWSSCADWCYWDYPLIELSGLMLGIVGLGRIGQAVATLGRGFGMKVIASSTKPTSPLTFVEMSSLEALLSQSDVVTLHCPLTPATQRLINRERLALMKPTALLINTSRGQLIDEPALAAALNEGRLAGAGLDVLSEEPPPAHHALLKARNCLITPHQAWGTRAARKRLMEIAAANLQAFLSGKPQHVVNAPPKK